jgi:alpha-beta hydrolase superfamily lysophospholipase
MPNPELCHDIISARLFFAIEKAGLAALEQAPTLTLPILLVHGAEDLVTCRKATELFHARARSEDKTLIIYPEARHETHNDLGRERVLADICDWIGERADRDLAVGLEENGPQHTE